MRKKLILTVGSRENNEEESFELGVEGWAELDSQTFWGETSQVEGIFCCKAEPTCAPGKAESQLTGAGAQWEQ